MESALEVALHQQRLSLPAVVDTMLPNKVSCVVVGPVGPVVAVQAPFETHLDTVKSEKECV